MTELAKREVAELLGLARKSGQLVAGFEKVEAALRAGRVRVLRLSVPDARGANFTAGAGQCYAHLRLRGSRNILR